MLYPLLFHPLLKPRVWGGRRLAAYGKNLPAGENIGESWELADLPPEIPQGQSIIANGPWAGETLAHVLAKHRHQIMGDANLSADGGFPLLIKFLDARENLSVQVHPTREYAAVHPGAKLKSEAWIVLEAAPGAVIYNGLKPGLTAAIFQQHIKNGQVENDLIAVPAQLGEGHYLPSGSCHALGAGVLVAEIQTPSDTTFRVYDWGRSERGAGRELHIAQALECIDFDQPHNPHRSSKTTIPFKGDATTILMTKHFEIEGVQTDKPLSFEIVTSELPEVWMMLEKSATLETQGALMVDLERGATALVPAGLKNCVAKVARGAWMLRVRPPSPLRGMIA